LPEVGVRLGTLDVVLDTPEILAKARCGDQLTLPVGVLYHHARGTPPKRLFWVPMRDGRFRIDWPRTNRGA
jgi:hypothetical protein